MNIDFNVDEILQIAEQIERNGEKFYNRAAENAPDEATKNMLLDLAAMESLHETTFKEMREGLSEQDRKSTVFDPDNECALYLQALADGKIFNTNADPAGLLTGSETIQYILETAIGMEKESVVFYAAMRDVVPARLGKDKVDTIIKEELGHVASLSGQLASLKR